MFEYEGFLPFPSQGDDSPIIPILIRLLLHLSRERDSAHDPIAKLLVQDRLVRIPIVLHNLIQPVDQGLFGRHIHRMTTERVTRQLSFQLGFLYPKDSCKVLDIFGGGLGLAVEDGCHCDFVAAEFLRDLLKGELLLGFGFEEGMRLDREAVCQRSLRLFSYGFLVVVKGATCVKR